MTDLRQSTTNADVFASVNPQLQVDTVNVDVFATINPQLQVPMICLDVWGGPPAISTTSGPIEMAVT
jgi:hypothetical protein